MTALPSTESSTGVQAKSFMFKTWPRTLGKPHADPEGLHSSYRDSVAHYGLTATQYFGFSVPQANIHSVLYVYQHPNLGTMAAGPVVWQGIKRNPLACEIFDYRAYLSDVALGDLSAYVLDNAYQVEVIDGGTSFRTRYEDTARGNRYDVTHVPVSERIYWPSGTHFEQVMRTKGEVVLGGMHFPVDGYHVRDRSWGELRLELPHMAPPTAWCTGVFGDDFSFCVVGSDHPALEPIWAGMYAVDEGSVLKFGWIMVDSEPVCIASLRKITIYDPATLIPRAVSIEVIDVRDRRFQFSGTVIAAASFYPYPNAHVPVSLVRWECNGRTGFGDVQDAQFTDFVRTFQTPST